MTKLAIRAEGLGKRYRLGTYAGPVYGKDLLGTVMNVARAPFDNFRRVRNLAAFGDDAGPDVFWALREVGFEMREGEVLGVVGRNGAGKSTLLKIISRITEPTTGFVEVAGRVGSLLEVGTGFHPELTGRENVYLNGSILGMDRGYIDRQFDAIVDFAGVAQFVDTPVKRYSSGMNLRLAFAVAAHLEPEVLVIDEVLAVGDAEFQRKCLAKMGDVARGGRTILFVSHNLDAVRALCPRSILLDGGRLVADGPTTDVIRQYLETTAERYLPGDWIDVSRAERSGRGGVRIRSVRYASDEPRLGLHPYTNGPVEFLMAVDSDARRPVGSVAVTLSSLSGTKLVNAESMMTGDVVTLEEGPNTIAVRIERLHLHAGRYRVSFWLADPLSADSRRSAFDFLEHVFEIEVVSREASSSGLKQEGIVPCDATFEAYADVGADGIARSRATEVPGARAAGSR
jgi:lipopolysaccharide transport system ATP-binding protein